MSRRIIKVVGIDPAFSNTGVCLADVDMDTKEVSPKSLHLIKTEKSINKKVRISSDNLERARKIYDQLTQYCHDRIVFAEIPSGTQSASAANKLGIATGIIACLTPNIIQVQQMETKLCSVGKKTATKEEMIDWAFGLYPNLNWLRRSKKSDHSDRSQLVLANEHLADAIGVLHAGVKNPEFTGLCHLFSLMKEKQSRTSDHKG